MQYEVELNRIIPIKEDVDSCSKVYNLLVQNIEPVHHPRTDTFCLVGKYISRRTNHWLRKPLRGGGGKGPGH